MFLYAIHSKDSCIDGNQTQKTGSYSLKRRRKGVRKERFCSRNRVAQDTHGSRISSTFRT